MKVLDHLDDDAVIVVNEGETVTRAFSCGLTDNEKYSEDKTKLALEIFI